MSTTPITVYFDFATARAIKVSAQALGISQSQFLRQCAAATLAQNPQTDLPPIHSPVGPAQ
jgi:hypothetical protein